ALVGIPGQLAPVLGPVIGGFVLSSVGWRWIFLGNVPVVALALALARRHLRTPAGRGGARLDAVGLALAAAGLAALLYGLSTAGQRAGLGGGVAATLAAGAVLLALFAVHAARARDRALVDLRLFRVAAFRAAAASLFLFGVSLYGPMLLLPLLFQEVHGATAAEVGWLLAPQGAGTMAVLWLAGRATDRAGPRPVAVAGVVLAALATLPFCGGATASGSPLLAASLVVRGAGLGAAGVAVLGAGYHGVAAAAIPRATSLLNVTQRVGASFGTALLAVVLQRGLDAAARPSEVAGAYAGAFRWSVALSLAALVPALALPRRRGAATAGPGGGVPRGRPAPMRT
ncbi:MAG TPA: MFS transporter, partial [Acidimicrobiales bacterium]